MNQHEHGQNKAKLKLLGWNNQCTPFSRIPLNNDDDDYNNNSSYLFYTQYVADTVLNPVIIFLNAAMILLV